MADIGSAAAFTTNEVQAMELYSISLIAIDEHVRKQFGPPEQNERSERPTTRPERPGVTTRARLAVGHALYALANAIDPGAPVPSRQH
jgi:hypothetical protein